MPMELGLAGKVAVVTGGSDGLGRAIAERLSAEGVRVAICARREGHLREAAAAIAAATGHEVLAVPLDISTPDAPARLIAATVERFGRLDILVNNAGTSAADAFERIPEELWAYDFDLKLFAAVRCAREAIPHMRRQGGGRIINILNTGAKAPRAGTLPTAAARAAGLALTKVLSLEYAAENILVNAICIGCASASRPSCPRRSSTSGSPPSGGCRSGASPMPASWPISSPSSSPSGRATSPAQRSTSMGA